MKTLLTLAACAALVSCKAPQSTNNIVVDNNLGDGGGLNQNPVGTVGGLVLDGSSASPLGGVTVKVIAGDVIVMTTTGSDGIFQAEQVPSGTYIAEFSASGRVTAMVTGLLGPASNDAVANPSATVGPIGLLPVGSPLTVRLVDDLGAPVPGVTVTLNTAISYLLVASSLFGEGGYSIGATTDATGHASFTGLPAYAALGTVANDLLTLVIPPAQVSGTDVYSFLGATYTLHGNALFGSDTPLVFTLAGPQTGLAVVATDLEYLLAPPSTRADGVEIPINGPIHVEFNQAIDPASLALTFYEEDGVTASAVQPTAQVDGNLLTLTPSQPLLAGHRYNALLQAIASDGSKAQGVNSQFRAVTPFFTPLAAGTPLAVVPSSVTLTTNGLVEVSFRLNAPIGLGFGNDVDTSCIAFYEGVNLDNGDPANYVGEWGGSGPLTCYAQGNPLPAMDITALFPVETTSPGLNTGFATLFTIRVNNIVPPTINSAACKPGDPPGMCLGPTAGNVIHLIFSKAGQSLHRTDGSAISDDPVNLVLTIP